MTIPARVRAARGSGWPLRGLLLALLLGIFGMHALAPHGASPASHAGAHVDPVGPAAGGTLLAAISGPVAAPAVVLSSTDGSDDGPSIVDLCVAVLLGLGLVAMLVLAARSRPVLALRSPPRGLPPAGRRGFVRNRRTLSELSLLRC